MRALSSVRAVRLGTAAIGVALVLLAPGAPLLARAQPKEALVKAAYLRHIAEFTAWPEGTFGDGDAPIVNCVLGEDDSGVVAALERRIRGKGLSAQSRRLDLRTLETDQALAAQLEGCHLLFVPDGQASNWKRLRRLLAERSIVTVSDIEGFARAEGMIEFVFDRSEGTINMHIDLVSVRNARLDLSARLLGLKERVTIVRAPGEGEA